MGYFLKGIFEMRHMIEEVKKKKKKKKKKDYNEQSKIFHDSLFLLLFRTFFFHEYLFEQKPLKMKNKKIRTNFSPLLIFS